MELLDDYLSKPLFEEFKLALTSSTCQWYWDEESGVYTHKIYENDSPMSDLYQMFDQVFRRRLNAKTWVSIKIYAYGPGQIIPPEPVGGKYLTFFYFDTNDGITSVTTEDGHESIEVKSNRVAEVETDEYTHTTYDEGPKRSLLLTLSYF